MCKILYLAKYFLNEVYPNFNYHLLNHFSLKDLKAFTFMNYNKKYNDTNPFFKVIMAIIIAESIIITITIIIIIGELVYFLVIL